MARLVKGKRRRKEQFYSFRCNGREIGVATVEPDPDETCTFHVENPKKALKLFIEVDYGDGRFKSGHECAETRKEAEEILRRIADRLTCNGNGK